jgi:hypothetical protein
MSDRGSRHDRAGRPALSPLAEHSASLAKPKTQVGGLRRGHVPHGDRVGAGEHRSGSRSTTGEPPAAPSVLEA